MIERELKNITEDLLRQLIADGIVEGKTLGFQRTLEIHTPQGRLNFLRCIASFANASGGNMVFGMAANSERKAEGLIPLSNFDPERDPIWLRDMIWMNTEPHGIFADFQPVCLSSGGYVLIVHVRKSCSGAHVVTLNEDFRFLTRDNSGMRLMDIPEIYRALSYRKIKEGHIEQFRKDRIERNIADDTPEPLVKSARLVLHLCPFEAFHPVNPYNPFILRALEGKHRTMLQPMYPGGTNTEYRYAYEGFYGTVPQRDSGSLGYCLAFHNGCLEFVDCGMLDMPGGIHCTYIAGKLMLVLTNAFEVLRLIGVEPLVAVTISLLNVRGYSLGTPWYKFFPDRHPIRKDHLLFPSVTTTTLEVRGNRENPGNTIPFLRPAFDRLWNACGYSQCMDFAVQGIWGTPPGIKPVGCTGVGEGCTK